MKRLVTAAALAVAAFVSTSAEAATVVNFNELAHNGAAKIHGTQPLASGGLSFSTNDNQGLASWGRNVTANANQGGATLMNWGGLSTITVSRVGGGRFNLGSVDLADLSNNGALSSLEVTFFDNGRSVSELFSLDRFRGLQTVKFNRDVEWFSIRYLSATGAQIDNIVWSEPVASAVPEPASWALMIVGFAGVGGMARRSRRQTQAALA